MTKTRITTVNICGGRRKPDADLSASLRAMLTRLAERPWSPPRPTIFISPEEMEVAKKTWPTIDWASHGFVVTGRIAPNIPTMERIIRAINTASTMRARAWTKLTLSRKMRNDLRAELLAFCADKGVVGADLVSGYWRTFKFRGLDVHWSRKARGIEIE